MSHTHFTIEERECILEPLACGLKNSEIAKILGKHRSSIGREIKRNSFKGKYSPFKAQKLYSQRKKNCGAKKKLNNSILLIEIQHRLEEGWTPEQISGRAKKDGSYNISFKTIYTAIKNGLFLENTVKFLPRKGKKKSNGSKETRGTIPDKKMIEERPPEADTRAEIVILKVIQ